MKKIEVSIDQLEDTLIALDKLVVDHGALRVGTAIQALVMKNPAVALFLAEANRIALGELAKRDAETCQCAECKAKRGQS